MGAMVEQVGAQLSSLRLREMNQWMLEGSRFVPGLSRRTAGRHLSLTQLGPSAGARIHETEGLVGGRKAAFVWWGRKVTVSPCLADVSASAYALPLHTTHFLLCRT